ncbi:MAG: hypothetical protein GF398_00250 [Chitinivibrionales bacterium]|nr:hypothetical protein [Chitinivibrionales bacterium]
MRNYTSSSLVVPAAVWCWLFACAIWSQSANAPCPNTQNLLYIEYADGVNEATYPAFSSELAGEISAAAHDINYCLRMRTSASPIDTGRQSHCLRISARTTDRLIANSSIDTSYLHNLRVHLSGCHPASPPALLVEIDFIQQEAAALPRLLATKIIENLRTQYLCHVKLASSPEKVRIVNKKGLSGMTPLEWVVPVGKISFSAEKEGYFSIDKIIILEHPGNHTFTFELKKRRFYHSKFVYPALLATLTSAAAAAADRYYYNKYQQLGKDDYYANPQLFEKYFERAQRAEGVAAGSLGLAALCWGMTFIF